MKEEQEQQVFNELRAIIKNYEFCVLIGFKTLEEAKEYGKTIETTLKGIKQYEH